MGQPTQQVPIGSTEVVIGVDPHKRSHTAAVVAGVLVALAAVPYFEVVANAKILGGFYATYRERLHPKPGTVPFPVPRAHDLYTYRQEASDLGALYKLSESMPPGPM